MDVYADLFDGEDERLAERLAELWWSHGGLEPAEDAFKLEQQRKKRGSD